MSNLSGSDIWDINAVSFVAPVSSQCFSHHLTAVDNWLLLGIRSSLVCPSVPTILLHALQPSRTLDGFHS